MQTTDEQAASHTSTPRRQHNLLAISVDVTMLVLIIVNLVLIVVDWLYGVDLLRQLFHQYVPLAAGFYGDVIHAHFTEIDLGFVAIYIVEFCAQWLYAIWARRYHRWFFYPFIHWYDLLGCIPVGSFRWLRVLRIFSILVRLHRMGWINLTETYPGQIAIKYYNMLVEEISDRIVINVLNGAQREITMGSPVLDRVRQDVLLPRKTALLDLASHRLAVSVEGAYAEHRQDLHAYLGHLADDVLTHSKAGKRLKDIPVAGQQISHLIQEQVRQIGLALVDRLVIDISSPANQQQINAVLDSLLQDDNDQPLTPIVQDIIYNIIEQVKSQIEVQQWKKEETLQSSSVDA